MFSSLAKPVISTSSFHLLKNVPVAGDAGWLAPEHIRSELILNSGAVSTVERGVNQFDGFWGCHVHVFPSGKRTGLDND